MTPETAIGAVTAMVGLLGAVAGLLQIIRSFRSSPAPPGNPGDIDDHLLDELVAAKVQLILMQRDVSHERGPVPGEEA